MTFYQLGSVKVYRKKFSWEICFWWSFFLTKNLPTMSIGLEILKWEHLYTQPLWFEPSKSFFHTISAYEKSSHISNWIKKGGKILWRMMIYFIFTFGHQDQKQTENDLFHWMLHFLCIYLTDMAPLLNSVDKINVWGETKIPLA